MKTIQILLASLVLIISPVQAQTMPAYTTTEIIYAGAPPTNLANTFGELTFQFTQGSSNAVFLNALTIDPLGYPNNYTVQLYQSGLGWSTYFTSGGPYARMIALNLGTSPSQGAGSILAINNQYLVASPTIGVASVPAPPGGTAPSLISMITFAPPTAISTGTDFIGFGNYTAALYQGTRPILRPMLYTSAFPNQSYDVLSTLLSIQSLPADLSITLGAVNQSLIATGSMISFASNTNESAFVLDYATGTFSALPMPYPNAVSSGGYGVADNGDILGYVFNDLFNPDDPCFLWIRDQSALSNFYNTSPIQPPISTTDRRNESVACTKINPNGLVIGTYTRNINNTPVIVPFVWNTRDPSKKAVMFIDSSFLASVGLLGVGPYPLTAELVDIADDNALLVRASTPTIAGTSTAILAKIY